MRSAKRGPTSPNRCKPPRTRARRPARWGCTNERSRLRRNGRAGSGRVGRPRRGRAAGWYAFLEYPTDIADLVGIVFAIGLALASLRLGGRVANALIPSYNVAEVTVEGPITRDGRPGSLPSPAGGPADDIVAEIQRADYDRAVDALLLELNTPGGEIVSSEDIGLAAERFDGPTVADATDVCASGGYEMASWCDELWARAGSPVGSIGVVGSRVAAADLADRLGISYEQSTVGEFKDAGTPLREVEPDEREYLQGLVYAYDEQFVDDVVDGRDVDEETAARRRRRCTWAATPKRPARSTNSVPGRT